MTPQIKPFICPQIDFNIFLRSCNEALGYSPMRCVDSCSRELSESARLLASLAAMHDRLDMADPIKSIRDAGSLLRHLSYSFLVYGASELISGIREKTQLNITSTQAPDGERVAVVSGSLFDFRTAVLECCIPESSFDIRYLFDCFMLYFEHIGLGDLWYDRRKKAHPDKTFLLEYKP